MEIIITEGQYKKILSENTSSDNKVINQIKKSINDDINRFVADNKVNLDKSSKILQPNEIINEFKNFLISQAPFALQGIKTGKGGDAFAETAYKKLYSIMQSNLNDIGWAKKQLIKTMAPNKDTLLKQMKRKDVSKYFMTFKGLIDFAFEIGWMDEVKPYFDNNNLFKWSDGTTEWVDKRQEIIKDNFINLIVNTIYK